jgi:hypothetical protein
MTQKIRHYIVGDIHGCFKEYLRLEKKLIKDAAGHGANYRIISCGDLIDRGPESKDVVEHFRKEHQNGTHELVLGNHEVMMLEVVHAFRPDLFENITLPKWFEPLEVLYQQEKATLGGLGLTEYKHQHLDSWIGQGGLETMHSFEFEPYNSRSWDFIKETLRFLMSAPLILEYEAFVVTHALPTRESLDVFISDEKASVHEKRQAAQTLLWNRSLKGVKPDQRIWVSGHTPYKGIRRSRRKKVLQIDTGCYSGGSLTAWIAEDNKFSRVYASL